ncbi:hypothetical protein [Alloalcanivorax mobilis]|uniref:hypothetical protein n=1 Tax=Alloalcanivorax mobilis TaxID=2019569 RepID=UPI000B5B471C|nr:hypothetical protein [Alloalcanivorax mobilis]ASK33462.1 hypothetical protein CEK62_03195 [Alcanivorax sp. N3-2A]|tara:strand:+ start:65545 stop:66030 length:486 start_codon:yes stop_codon:yes gene_type:complete
MNLYYREERLCGQQSGNGRPRGWLERLTSPVRPGELEEAFPLSEINAVLYNRHNSIGCSVKAPLGNVMWRNEALWYTLPCQVGAYIPRHLAFTDGRRDVYLVVIGGACEPRLWPDSRERNRSPDQWFSHRPLVRRGDFLALKESFAALVAHVRKEDRLADQ